MKKVILIFSMLLISKNINAEGVFDNTIFGVSFISQSVDIEVTTTGTVTESTDSGSGFGLYLDKYYKKKFRFNSTLSYIGYDTFDIAQLMFSADYLLPVNSRISFFGGVAAGGALQKYSDVGAGDSALGAVYGVQLGGIAFINDNLMLELGYRLRPSSGIETEVVNTDSIISVTDLSEVYFGILLMF